jgi:lipopolysaccharide/colanic/teichoic acid biosynthesis glycosyltransferase
MSTPPSDRGVLGESDFRRIISLERRRTERSERPFLLMLLDFGGRVPADNHFQSLCQVLKGLALSTRDTDTKGWYRQNSIVGAVFTDLDNESRNGVLGNMLARVVGSLRECLTFEQLNQVSISLHLFPEKWEQDGQRFPGNPILYPDLVEEAKSNKLFCAMKRLLDIVGSIAALILFSPLFAVIGLLVKVSSKGPVLFQQERLGQFGETFNFLKFRSMYEDNDVKIHREFIKHVIKGDHNDTMQGGDNPVYKMTNDPRVTRIGRFLRRTSLDELPQFLNVLKGDMSLVGPRPPLAYEYLDYELWHRRRVIEAKPGLTGMWQVNGRSRIGFNDMVRLDLRYVRTCSLWLDIQILLQTPKAVLLGNDSF